MSQTNQREHDLVRQMRLELFGEHLITQEEYAALASEHGGVQRLEDYDQVRARMEALESALWQLYQDATNPELQGNRKTGDVLEMQNEENIKELLKDLCVCGHAKWQHTKYGCNECRCSGMKVDLTARRRELLKQCQENDSVLETGALATTKKP